MKYRMLAMDMDGTLLTNDKKISTKTKDALKRAADMGVKLVVCTGRIFASARTYGEILGVDTPIIASNGAYIREKDRDEVIYIKPLGEENARKIVEISRGSQSFHLFTCDTVFTEKLVYSALNYSRWNEELPEDRQVKISIIKADQWDEVIEKYKDTILKAIFYNECAEDLAALRKELSRLDVEIASAASSSFEVMHKGVSKGNAVKTLGEYLKIPREEIICIGDNENDISMIKYAGLGIAMGNATEEAKKAADFVTLSNEEDGVAYAIEKFILE